MKLLVTFFLLFFSSLEAVSLKEIPVLYEGRYRPFGTLPKSEQSIDHALLIPIKTVPWQRDAGEWVPLTSLKEISKNFTPYPDEYYLAIKKAYLENDESKLAETLLDAYKATLAGTVYKQAIDKELIYPKMLQLKAELRLFQIPFSVIVLAVYLCSLISFLLRNRNLAIAFLTCGFVIHTGLLIVRCFVLKRPPVANMTETLLYVPWIAILSSLFFYKRQWVLFASTLGASVLLFFVPIRQDLSNVQAVLDSRSWLLIHVMMVVGSYGFFLVSGILGHIYLLKKRATQSFENTLLQMMYIGTIFLISGTLLGGVWAAQSWGRFWDWDPKESWAFISSGVYLIVIHAYQFKKISGKGLAMGSVLGLLSITFTWYGVNYLLGSGLHSYGFGNGGEWAYYTYLFFELLFLFTLPLIKKIIYTNGES